MEKEVAVQETKQKREDIHGAVTLALKEGFPVGTNEKEQFFMSHVQQGETLGMDRELMPLRCITRLLFRYRRKIWTGKNENTNMVFPNL